MRANQPTRLLFYVLRHQLPLQAARRELALTEFLNNYSPILTPHKFRASTALRTRIPCRNAFGNRKVISANTCHKFKQTSTAVGCPIIRFLKHNRNKTKNSITAVKQRKQASLWVSQA